MGDDPRCEGVRDALVEVALGIASGEERARVLEHVADCPACQRVLAELTDTADGLLRLAPAHEPPPGFELCALTAVGAGRRPPRRRWAWRLVPALAAALAAAAFAAAGVLLATRDERRLGQQLAGVLARAEGSYIAVTELRDDRRRKVGVVFHYGGRPSWVFATLDRPLPAGRYRATLVRRDGTAAGLGTYTLGPRGRSIGSAARIDLREVAQLRLRHVRDGTTYVADF